MKLYCLLTGAIIAYFASGIRSSSVKADCAGVFVLQDEILYRHSLSAMFCIYWGVLSVSKLSPLAAVLVCILPGGLLGYVWMIVRKRMCDTEKGNTAFGSDEYRTIKPLPWWIDAISVVTISLLGAPIGYLLP